MKILKFIGVFFVFCLIVAWFTPSTTTNTTTNTTATSTTTTAAENLEEQASDDPSSDATVEEIIGKNFSDITTVEPMKARNDVTGNYRVLTIADNCNMEEYAVDYYKKNFKSDSEVHGIVNFTLNTTTCITVMGDKLDVRVHEYVKKEEHDAKLMFSGMLLSEYFVNKADGAIEKIQ